MIAELFRALASLAEPPACGTERIWYELGLATPPAEAFTELFVLQLPPYASIYVGAEGMVGGEARDRIAGFFRALGATPPPEPDHLAALLHLYVTLAEHAPAEAVSFRAALLHEHLVSWLPAYLRKVDEVAAPAYRSWAQLLHETLLEEAEDLPPLDGLALHLRTAPTLPDPRLEGAESFLRGLLAPVRSGMVIVRDDLRRAARDLQLGLRVGERRYILSALFGQEPAATLGWLADEAHCWAHRHSDPFWRDRAEGTAAMLKELRTSTLREVPA